MAAFDPAGDRKIILRNLTIRWNSPLNFNDPFDCYFSVGFNFQLAEYRETVIRRITETVLGSAEPTFDLTNPLGIAYALLRSNREGISEDELRGKIVAGVDESIAKFQDGFGSEESRWRADMGNYRLLCVCEEVDNLLLWSHYAEEHRGIALQFECIPELDVPLLIANPVIYSDSPPSMATPEEWIDVLCGVRPLPKQKDAWHRLMHTKSSVWRDEKEWRVVTTARPSDHGSFEDTPFHPREISRVFLGCRMTKEDRAAILTLATGPFAHVEVHQAIQKTRSYGVHFERVR